MNNRQNPFTRLIHSVITAFKQRAAKGIFTRIGPQQLPTEKNLLLVSFLLIIGILFLGWKSYTNNAENKEINERVDHTRQVLYDAEQIATAVKDLELGVRGYIITGDYSFLGPFYTTQQTVFTRITNLKSLCKDNREQQSRLDTLKKNLQIKLAFLESSIAIRKKQGTLAAENYIISHPDINRIKFLDKTIEDIKTDEVANLAARKQASEASNAIFSKVNSFGATLLVALVIATTYILWRNTLTTTKAREQLEDNRQLLQNIIDNTSSIIYVKDIFGRFTMINKQFEKTHQLSTEEVLGKTVFDINPEHYAMEFARNDARVLEDRTLIESEETGLAQGETRHYYSIKFPLINRSNEVYAIAGVSTDITDIILKQRIEKERDLVEQTLRTQENERKEIGLELHDNISQLLASAKMMLDTALRNVERRDERLEKAREDVFTAITETRKLSHSLVAPISEKQPLSGAIEDLAKGLNMGTKIKATVSIQGRKQLDALDEKLKLTIYRIIQEQTHNIIKYSKGNTAQIVLNLKDGQLQLQIKDNGVGFDPAKKGRGIGLQNILNRTEFYKGTMQIHSAPNEGCELHIAIPVQKETVLG